MRKIIYWGNFKKKKSTALIAINPNPICFSSVTADERQRAASPVPTLFITCSNSVHHLFQLRRVSWVIDYAAMNGKKTSARINVLFKYIIAYIIFLRKLKFKKKKEKITGSSSVRIFWAFWQNPESKRDISPAWSVLSLWASYQTDLCVSACIMVYIDSQQPEARFSPMRWTERCLTGIESIKRSVRKKSL